MSQEVFFQWRVFCITEQTNQTVWQLEEPTVCPVDGQPIDTQQTVIVDTADQKIRFSPTKTVSTPGINTKCTNFNFPGATVMRVEVLSYLVDATSYTIKVTDLTNSNLLGQSTFTNTVTQVNVIEPLTNIPEEPATIEVSITVNGASGSATLDYVCVIYK
jgi:hypothetical protein